MQAPPLKNAINCAHHICNAILKLGPANSADLQFTKDITKKVLVLALPPLRLLHPSRGKHIGGVKTP